MVLAALVALAATLDFVSRCSRNITDNDPAELQVLALAGGVPHGTSYPLYIWLLRGFSWLPFGPVALRLNVFSAVCAGVTLFGMAWLCSLLDTRRPTRGWLAGTFAGVTMALSHSFVSIAIFTGMYTLHLAMACIGLGFFVRWTQHRRGRDIEIALALFGAMLGNHILTLALAPGVFVVLAWSLLVDRSQWTSVLRGIGWAVAAVLLFDVFLFFLLWRNRVPYDHWWGVVLSAPDFFEVSPQQGKSFWYAWWYEATCRQFRYDTVGASWDQRVQQLALVVPRTFAEVSPAVTIFAGAGVARLLLQRKLRLATLVVLLVFMHVYLATGYTATVKTHIYLLPVTMLVAVLAGHGLLWPLDLLPKKRRLWGTPALAALLAALGLVALKLSHAAFAKAVSAHVEPTYAPVKRAVGPRPDASEERRPLERARAIVSLLPPRALVFTDWDVIYAMHYVGRFERRSHELEIYDPYMYGRPTFGFVSDYKARILDPARTDRVFFVGRTRPPPLAGFALEPRGGEVHELVRR